TAENSVSGRRTPPARKRQSFRPMLECLEDRLTPALPLKAGPPISLPIQVVPSSNGVHGFPTPEATGGFVPSQIRRAYGIDQVMSGNIAGDGSGQTLPIIDAFDTPGLVSSTAPNSNTSDLHQSAPPFGLPDPPSFTKLDQNGGTNFPPTN